METDLLTSLIDQKLASLEQIRQLSRRQSDLVARGEMTGLMNVLSVKQSLIIELTKLERQLDPFREQDPDSRQWRTPADRLHCRQLAERCSALLQEIMLIEKQCELELRARRDDVAHKLESIQHAAHARAAYIEFAPQHGACQLDLTSDK